MAGKGTVGSGLNFVARLDTDTFKKQKAEFEKMLADLKISTSKATGQGFDTKPMTEYQKAQTRIKEEALQLAKQKQEAATADRSASLATQEALQKERLAILERNKAIADAKLVQLEKNAADKESLRLAKEQAAVKRPVSISNSQVEIDAYNRGQSNGNGRVASSGTSELIRLLNEDFAAGKISAADYKVEIERLNAIMKQSTVVTKDADEAVKGKTLTAKEQARLLAEEKYLQAQATKELKNNIREQLNAKGSLENRRAALIRLQTAFDRLSVAERASPAGQRLDGIVTRLNEQVLTLERNTGRAGRNVGNYLNKAWSGLKLIANILPGLGIAGVIGFALDPLIAYVKTLDIFKKKVTEAKLASEGLAKAYESSEYSAAVKNVNELRINIDLAKDGFLNKKEVVKQYNETIGKTTGQVKSLNEAETALNANADSYIQFTLKKAAAQLALEDASKQAFEAAVQAQKDQERLQRQSTAPVIAGDKEGAAVQKILTKQLQRENKEREKNANDSVKKQLAIADKFQKDAATIAKKNNFSFTGKFGDKSDLKQVESNLKLQRNLQKRITEIQDEATRKQLSREDQEIQAVKDKFAAIRKEAESHNAKYKGTKFMVDTGGLSGAMNSQIKAIEYRAETDRTMKFIDEQKALYAEYEQYKIDFGKAAADKRFKNELDTSISYLEDLKMREASLVSKGNLSDPEQEKLKAVQARIKSEELLELKKNDTIFANAFQAAKTFNDQALEIERQFQIEKAALESRGEATPERIAILVKQKDARIRSVNEENAYAKAGYADLMMNYDELTRGAILKRLEEIKEGYRKEYAAGKLTAEQMAKLVAQVNSQIDTLNGDNVFRKISQSVQKYRDALKSLPSDSEGVKKAQQEMYGAIAEGAAGGAAIVDTLGNSFAQLGIGTEQLQADLKNISGILGGGGEIAKGLATGNPVDVVTGSIKLLTSAIELFNFKDKKLNKQIKQYQAQLDSLGKAYKQLERDVSNSVGESIYTDQAAQIENLKRQQQELIKMRQAENDKKKTDANKVKEYTDQIDAIPGQIEDIEKAISQNLIQGTFKDLSNSLADAFSEAFKAGEDGIAKMDDVFNGFIANAIKNSLKLKILDPVVKKFTDQLTDYAKDNNNSIVGFDFEDWRKKLREAGELFNAGLKGSEEFFKDVIEPSATDPKKGISGAVVGEAIKEDTANRLIGIAQGTYDYTKRTSMTLSDIYLIAANHYKVVQEIAVHTKRSADNTEGIGQKLDKIAENTTPKTGTSDPLGQSLRDAGIKI